MREPDLLGLALSTLRMDKSVVEILLRRLLRRTRQYIFNSIPKEIENLMNIETVWANLEQVGATKISENTVDEALLINILFQSRQNTNFLQEAKRLMKSGGKLLVIDWKVEPTPFGPPLQNRMTPEAIRALGEGVGFKVQEQFEAGPYHYGLILVKQ